MNLEKDFVCDYALKLFTERHTFSEIYFPITQIPTSRNKDVLARQLLFSITSSVTRAKPDDIRIVRMVFEELPGMIKSLKAFTEDAVLQLCINDYYEEVIGMLQLVALESQHEHTSLSEPLQHLKLSTLVLVAKFRKHLKPPFLLNVFQDYQRKLEERSGKRDSESASGSSPENQVFTENRGSNREAEKQTMVESVASKSAVRVSENRSERENAAEEQDDRDLSSFEIASFNSDETQDLSIKSDMISFSERTSENETHSQSSKTGKRRSCKTAMTFIGHSQPNLPVTKEANSTNIFITQAEKNHKCPSEQSSAIEHNKSGPDTVASSGFDKESNPTKVRQRHPFSVESDTMLIHGIERYGTAEWKTIRDHYTFPSYRKPAHLKDRWRTLLSKGIVSFDGKAVSITAEEQAKAYKAYLKKRPSIGDPPVPTINLGRPSSSPEKEANLSPCSTQSFYGSPRAVSSTRKKRSDEEAKSPEEPDKASTQYRSTIKRRRRLWEAEGEAMTWDSPLFNQTPTVGRKHRKKPWNDWEIENLLKGMRRYGIGQWTTILTHYKFSDRNSVMLKDKYRNMLKNHELPRDLLRGVKT